jgi:hypothetical protein
MEDEIFSYTKLIVDGKILYVFENGKIPVSIVRLDKYEGIVFEKATYKERKPFEALEKTRKETEDDNKRKT